MVCLSVTTGASDSLYCNAKPRGLRLVDVTLSRRVGWTAIG
jgi:hypothetical protein